jgi:uncharacterized protein
VAIINILKKQTLNIHQLPSGHFLDINVYHYNANTPLAEKGKTAYIQASVHGSELQGNLVIHELHQMLKKVNVLGHITMVPLANPIATNQKMGQYTQGRFNPTTGDNWNRNYTDILSVKSKLSNFSLDDFCKNSSFKSHETIRKDFKVELKNSLLQYKKYILNKRGPSLNCIPNLTYQILASDADIVLDLHTGPYATDYIYSAEYQKELAQDLGFPFYLIIPNKFAGAMDEACFTPWFSLQEKIYKHNKDFNSDFEAYTIELGNEELVSSSKARVQALRLLSYLAKRGVVEPLNSNFLNELQPPDKKRWCLLKDYNSLYAPSGGIFEYLQTPGSLVKRGDILGRYYKIQELDQEETTEELRAEKDYYLINHNVSSSVHLGTPLFQLMENFHDY